MHLSGRVCECVFEYGWFFVASHMSERECVCVCVRKKKTHATETRRNKSEAQLYKRLKRTPNKTMMMMTKNKWKLFLYEVFFARWFFFSFYQRNWQTMVPFSHCCQLVVCAMYSFSFVFNARNWNEEVDRRGRERVENGKNPRRHTFQTKTAFLAV